LPLWPPPRGALLLTLCAPSPPASPYPPYTPTLALHDALPISDLSLMTTAMLPHGMSFWQPQVQSASIDHSIWFLRPCRVDEWLLYSMDSPSAAGARGFNRGTIYRQDGTMVAATAQEGLMRVLPKS